MEKLVIDTNYLVYLAKEKKFDKLFELIKIYDCYIIKGTINEIEKLKKGKYKLRINLLLEEINKLIKEKKLKIIETNNVDATILKLASEGFNVASYDKEIEKKINKLIKEKKLKIKIIKDLKKFKT
ncbi:MAG: hypothetical protein QXO12_00880 [Candidatus Pacearchaeota archaeon]